jgi:hypothetical protein
MSTAFSFFLRLFLCFAAARFLLQTIGVGGRGYLVGLTILFLANVYLFSYLVFRDRTAAPVGVDRGQPQGPADAGSEAGRTPEDQVPPGA